MAERPVAARSLNAQTVRLPLGFGDVSPLQAAGLAAVIVLFVLLSYLGSRLILRPKPQQND